jgi:hypothetical protein
LPLGIPLGVVGKCEEHRSIRPRFASGFPVAFRVLRTRSCWRRNAISASRAACDLYSPTSNPPSSFKRSIIPARE